MRPSLDLYQFQLLHLLGRYDYRRSRLNVGFFLHRSCVPDLEGLQVVACQLAEGATERAAPRLVNHIALHHQRVALDGIAVQIEEQQIERGHLDAGVVEVLAEECGFISLLLCHRLGRLDEHNASAAGGVVDIAVRTGQFGHHAGDMLRGEELPRMLVADIPLHVYFAQDFFVGGRHMLHEKAERIGKAVNFSFTLGLLVVISVNNLQVIVVIPLKRIDHQIEPVSEYIVSVVASVNNRG